jgi:alpha-tubulin suppressor-like RCC1 family protein
MKIRRNLIQIWLVLLALSTSTVFAQPVTKVAAGFYQSLFLKSDGSLWTMGYNNYGQLGDGTFNNTNRPEQIVATNVVTIAAGDWHSLFLKSDGSLWSMGYNWFGELGDGTTDGGNFKTNQPEQIVASNVTAIAAGDWHSLFLKTDGSLWGMGDSGYGELGAYLETNMPMEIMASNVTAIAAGFYHSLFLKKDGSLWATGDDTYGQLGDGASGSVMIHYEVYSPEQIVASNVTAIAAGLYHSLFLKKDGSLWGMGENNSGQLGDGTYINTNRPEQIVASNVVAIAGGGQHSLFLKRDGSLWVMGYNNYGELGDGTFNNANRPEQIVASGVMAFAGGGQHSFFIKSDGSLWGMGYNNYGQLGDGTFNITNRPELIAFNPGYNQICCQLLGGINMRLNFVGVANANYALERATTLSPPNWIPQLTNAAGSFGALVFSNAPDATTNNFWRIRSVP